MKKLFSGAIFFIGWVLSPLTWWNDVFVNIPLSYIIANLIYYITRFNFGWLVVLSYWATNILGILLMVISGKEFVLSKKNVNATAVLIIAVILYSVIMIYLDKTGRLHPIGAYLGGPAKNP